MLVLTRKLEEKIKIGDNIIINILEIESGSVKIGIDAPREVSIYRMELLEQIKNKNIESAAKEITDVTDAAAFIKSKINKKK